MQLLELNLSDLKLDPANVRHSDGVPDEGLLSSIRSKGLIVPLTVRKNAEGYYVTDGGKRLAALQLLAREGGNGRDGPVACVLRDETDATARDISLTTNFIREDMHPVDVFEAFADLRAAGKITEQIAKDYGLPLPVVRQYLALGQLSPKIRGAWKAGEFDGYGDEDPQQIAQIFTLAGDQESQDAAYTKLKKQKRLTNAWQVRDAIVGNSNDGGRFVAFVGVDAYKAAGGTMVEDLFGADHRVEDLAIARKLVDEKLLAECAQAIEQGWSWAEPLSALPKGCEHSWQRAYDSVEEFAKARRKDWGLALYVDNKGKLDEYIMQKPEQKKAAEKAAKTKEKKKAAASGEGAAAEPVLSQALCQKLSTTLTEAAAQAIIAQPELAFAIGLAALMTQHGTVSVKLRCDGLGAGDDSEDEWEFDKALAHVLKLTPKQRAASFAMHVGRSFSFVRAHGSPLDPENGDAHVVCNAIDPAAMNKALREKFDAAHFFASASKDIALKAILECDRKYVAKDFASNKKSDTALIAVESAQLHGWLPAELRTKHYDGPGSKGYGPVTKADKQRAAKSSTKKASTKAKKRA